jgi:hypothetical protein
MKEEDVRVLVQKKIQKKYGFGYSFEIKKVSQEKNGLTLIDFR